MHVCQLLRISDRSFIFYQQLCRQWFSVAIMNLKIDQRAAVKFCVGLNKAPAETYEIIEIALKESILSRAHVFEWHKNC